MTELTRNANGSGAPPDDQPTTEFTLGGVIVSAPNAPEAPATVAIPPHQPAASEPERVVCPECGTAAVITLNRRDSVDFCKQCDFPLFWTPTAIMRDEAARANDESLRRLPGTVGRVTVASVPCPHCAEPNLLSAQVCVRCGLPMRVVAQAAPLAPVYVPPPPEPVAEPETGVPWWVWAAIAIILAATIALIVLGVTGVIG
jgi:hypothetical protein